MRISLFLLSLLTFSSTHAADLSWFHGANYIGTGDYCGAHLEVSGRTLVTTNIIPPDSAHDNCSTASYRSCTGGTVVYTCDSSGGLCRDEQGLAVLLLLEDGNFVNLIANVKFLFANRGQYWWCNN